MRFDILWTFLGEIIVSFVLYDCYYNIETLCKESFIVSTCTLGNICDQGCEEGNQTSCDT